MIVVDAVFFFNFVDDDGQLIVSCVLAHKLFFPIITMCKFTRMYKYDAMMFGRIGLNGSGRAFALKNNNNKRSVRSVRC